MYFILIFEFLGQSTISKLLKMTDEDEELAYSGPGAAELTPSDARPMWMRQLFEASSHWLKLLPTVITSILLVCIV